LKYTNIRICILILLFKSFVFGIERQKSHKPVGFGTFIFVALGSCALAVTAIALSPENPLPLLSAIVTGIGFLGAGALVRTTDKIYGFTTAASIWVFAIVGLIIGTGNYAEGIALYILLWGVVYCDRYFENRGIGSYQKRLTVHVNKIISPRDIEKVLSLGITNYKLISLDMDKKSSKGSFIYLIQGFKQQINHVSKDLFKEEWFESIKVE